MTSSIFAWPWQQAAGPRSKRHNDESVQSPQAINQTTDSSSTSQPTAKGADLALPATSSESGTVNPSPSGIPEAEREFIVFLDDAPGQGGVAQRAQALMRSLGVNGQPTLVFEQLNGFALRITDQQARRLQALGGVKGVEANASVFLEPPILSATTGGSALQPGAIGTASLPSYTNGTAGSGETLPWGVRAVWQGSDVSTRGNFADDTYAFVIDSGVLNSTGDLNLASTDSWHRSWVSGETAFTDGNGHGSHVAGTIAALANGKGVVGVAPGAQVVSLKVFNSRGGGASYTSIIDAINHAVAVINNNGLNKNKVVINMSLGGGFSSSLDTAVKNAAGQGIRLAVAAGNGDSSGVGQDADGYSPAAAGDHPNVFTISAVDSQYRMAKWSNWDRLDSTDSVDDVVFAAPGVSVLSYYQNGQLAYLSGTSMAAPHVAGLLLAGGVQAGSLVTPYYSATADPFAMGVVSTSDPQPPTTNPEPPSTNQILWGTTGSDSITGGGGNDQLAGVPASGTTASELGRSQIDTLTGGAGADLFLLADSRGTFYNDGNSRSQGTGDYALIKDFKTAESDRLQLRAGTQVLYRNVTINGIANTEIFLGNGDNRFNSADELIARLENTALAPGSGVAVVGGQSWATYA